MDYRQFIYKPGKSTALENFDSDIAAGAGFDEAKSQAALREYAESIAKYQDVLMAHERYGLLVIFQGMDGAGKDAMIKNVMSSLDPQGAKMTLFKEPTERELRHDYLWRAARGVPARGQIGVFNRSYYEQVVAERVRPEKLEKYNFPEETLGRNLWKKRYRHINNFEEYLRDNGIHTLKFFLNLSKDRQREKLLERIERTDKRWKFSADDLDDRRLWNEYLKIYDEVFQHTSKPLARWHIIPDDDRWFARAIVAKIIADKLKSLHRRYPALNDRQKREIEAARKTLESEDQKQN